MKIKYITNDSIKENSISVQKDFPNLTKDSFHFDDKTNSFTIAQYTDDGVSYVEITLSLEETAKLFKYLY